jgi:hypothetical protein
MCGTAGYSVAGWDNSAVIEANAASVGSGTRALYLGAYNGPVIFATGSSTRNERARISATGDFGIGTTNPAAKLDVQVSGLAQLLIGYQTGGTSYNYYGANNHIFRLGNDSELMRLTSTGLGIGISSVVYPLHVEKAKAGDALVSFKNTSATGDGLIIQIADNAYNALRIFDSAGSPSFRVKGSGETYIAGNVGIGTSSPAAKLNTSIAAGSASATNIHLLLSETGTNSDTGLQIKATNSTNSWDAGSITFRREGAANSYGLVFATSSGGTNGNRATLDSAGNLGLGVTPSAWRTDFNARALQLNNASFATFNDDSLYVAQNAFLSATGWKYISTNAATTYVQNAGTHSWNIAASGTAGNAISFTQAMTLDASGNLALGITSVARGNLHINSAASATTAIHLTNSTSGSTSGDGLTLESSGNDAYLWLRENGFMGFATNNTERARITSGGFFKASNTGTYANSTGDFHELRSSVDGVTVKIANTLSSGFNNEMVQLQFTGYAPNTSTNSFIYAYDTDGLRFNVRSNGGIANYSANDVNLSDRREKTNFAPAKSYLETICAIPVQTFNYIDQNMEDDGGLTLGVVAQDVQAVAPELVMESNWGTKEDPKMRLSIYQTDLQYALMKCIQEQQALIQSLKARLDAANL